MGMKKRKKLQDFRDLKAAAGDKVEGIMTVINCNTELCLLNIYYRCWKLNITPD
jgi:hypothetical protein